MDSPILDKVRKLLSKTTEANCTQAEADGAMQAASRLLAQHNLSMADIVSTQSVSADVWTEELTFKTGRWTAIHNLAYGVVSEFCCVKRQFMMSSGVQRRIRNLYLFGLRDNVETAKFMFIVLLGNFDGLWQNYYARSQCDLKDKYSYIFGVAAGFSDKMRAERMKFSVEQDIQDNRASGGTAIMLSSVMEKTELAFRGKHPNLKTANITFGVSNNSDDARNAGYQAGQQLNINRSISNG